VCAEISRLGGLAALIRLLSHEDGACRCVKVRLRVRVAQAT